MLPGFSDEPFSGITGASGSLCAEALSALPLAVAPSGEAPSGEGFLLASSRLAAAA